MKKSFEEFVREYEECCEIYGERFRDFEEDAVEAMDASLGAMYSAYPEETRKYVNDRIKEIYGED